MSCHLFADRVQWPEAGNGLCCDGAAYYGPERCTCWVPVYDLDQQPPRTSEPSGAQPKMCVDCAYRPSSPERSGDPQAAADTDELHRIVEAGEPFWCHQGMRRPTLYRHPSGAEYVTPGAALAYTPPVVDAVPYQADGTPGLLCGGWIALRLKAMSGPAAAERGHQ